MHLIRPRPPRRWPTAGRLPLAAILPVEIIGLSVAFDAGVRADDPGWAGALVYRSPELLRSAVAGLLAGAAIVGWKSRRELRTAARTPGRPALWLGAHVAAFTAFAVATDLVLGPSTAGAPVGLGAVVAWLAAGLLVVGTWLAALVEPRAWPRLARRTRAAWLAGLGVAVAALPLTDLARRGWDDLAGPTLWASDHLLRLFADDVVCDPATRTLGTPRFWVIIAPQCSGLEGMGLIALFLVGYLALARREVRFPAALLMIPAGVAAVWVLNAVRIAALVVLGDRVSPELALGGFHSQAGWLGFGLVAVGLVAATHRSKLLARERPASRPSAALAYLAPLLAAVLIETLAVAFLPEPNLLYPARGLAALAALAWFWPRYEGLRRVAPGRRVSFPTAWAAAVGGAVYIAWVGLARVGLASGAGEWLPPAGSPPWVATAWPIACSVGFVVVTPLAEELAFRGFLLRRLIAADFESVPPGRLTMRSLAGSSLAFGLLHNDWLAATAAGAAYAVLVARTGRLRDAVLAHAVTNTLLLMPPVTHFGT